jgi:hypothetical protein
VLAGSDGNTLVRAEVALGQFDCDVPSSRSIKSAQSPPLPVGEILLPAPEFGRSVEEAATAAPNKIQFNGVGGLRTYITFTRIGDQSSR